MDVVNVPIHQILVQEGFNPRDDIGDKALKQLASSIETNGLMQPLIVRQDPANAESYLLIGGHRRLAALESLGHANVPVTVIEPGSESVELVASVVENTMRVDLNIIEEAMAYRRLLDQGYNNRQVANELAVSEKLVRDRVALLSLPDPIIALIASGDVSPKAAPRLTLLAAVSPEAAVNACRVAIKIQANTQQLINQLGDFAERAESKKYWVSVDGTPPKGYENAEVEAARTVGDQKLYIRIPKEVQDAAVATGTAWADDDDKDRTPFVVWADEPSLKAALLAGAAVAKKRHATLHKDEAKSKATSSSDKDKTERLRKIEEQKKASVKARNANQKLWSDLFSAKALKLSLADARQVARAMLKPYEKELARAVAVCAPTLAIQPPEGKSKWEYDVGAAPAFISAYLAGATSADEVMQRTLTLFAVAAGTNWQVYPPSGRPSQHKVEESHAAKTAAYLFGQLMPTGRRVAKLPAWDAGLGK